MVRPQPEGLKGVLFESSSKLVASHGSESIPTVLGFRALQTGLYGIRIASGIPVLTGNGHEHLRTKQRLANGSRGSAASFAITVVELGIGQFFPAPVEIVRTVNGTDILPYLRERS